MNKVYKSVWNESIGAWVAVSENSPARGKRSSRLVKSALASAVAFGAAGEASASVTLDGGVVVTSPVGITNGVAIGAGSSANADYGTATGPGAKATGVGDVAMGADAKAYSASLTGDAGKLGSVAVGSNASAMAVSAASFGALANASGAQSTAIGSHATASATASTAIGMNAVADRANTVSIGNSTTQRQLVQVARGTQTNDAVNVSQLTPVLTALGGKAAVNADGSITAPAYSLKGTTYNNVGDALTALADSSGKYFHANSTLADSSAAGDESVAIGGAANAVDSGDVAIGRQSYADGKKSNAIALGTYASATGENAMAIGDSSVTSANRAEAFGAHASATAADALAIGHGAKASVANSIALGANSVADRVDTVSVGSAAGMRQITNVANGTQANDAVNVSQLQSVTTLLGGGAALKPDGTVTAPAYAVAGTTLGTVGAAIAKIDSELGNKVTYDAADKSRVTLGGTTALTPVALSNVKAGALSAASTDAVNGSQLFATNTDVSALKTFTDDIKNGGGIKYFHTNSKLADSAAAGMDSVAIGGGANASSDNAVALGSNSVADRPNSVSVGAAGKERQITNVAAGMAFTDAVNVQQLNAISDSAVKYDTNPDGTPNYQSVNLGGNSN
jgi:autotransporter adhesin